MTTAQVRHYRDLSAEYLRKARAHLDERDLPQASEKGWGAAAVLVKAAAEQRGWRHNAHRHLWRAVRSLEMEGGNPEIRPLFGLAGQLHANFYEDSLEAEEVAEYLDEVERLTQQLRQVTLDA